MPENKEGWPEFYTPSINTLFISVVHNPIHSMYNIMYCY